MLTAESSESFNKLNLDENWDQTDKSSDLPEEPVLVPNPKRFVLFPVQFHEVWQAYKIAESRFWTAEDVELSDDVQAWGSLSGKERAFIMHAVGMIAGNDAMIGETVDSKLSDNIQIPEARCFFGFQMMQRNIHAELFTVVLDIYCKPAERDYVFDGLKQLPSISKKTAWVQRHITDSSEHFSVRLAALAIYNAVFQSTVVACLLHLAAPKRSATTPTAPFLPGLIRGLARLNRDNETYYRFCNLLGSILVNRPPTSTIHMMANEAAQVQKQVFADMLSICGGTINLLGHPIDAAQMEQRIRHVTDRTLVGMGFSKLYKAENPLPWMDEVLATETGDEASTQKQPPSGTSNGGGQPMAADEGFTIDADF
ncbi:ribonucleoside-diphosphate reductase [Spizellomyces sp. 'palustris']|nr:ribonucleoside-diphosphate reductase [Spizellomyces sp. 'palustris']